MEIRVERNAECIRFRLFGNLSHTSDAAAFHDAVMRDVQETDREIIFDLNESSIPDSRFIGTLIELYKAFKSQNRKTCLSCSSNEDTLELIQISCLDKLMPLVDGATDEIHQHTE